MNRRRGTFQTTAAAASALVLAALLAELASAQGREAPGRMPAQSRPEGRITQAAFERPEAAPGSVVGLLVELSVTKSGAEPADADGARPPADIWLVLNRDGTTLNRQKLDGSRRGRAGLRHTFQVKAPDNPGQACFELVASLGPGAQVRLDSRKACVKVVSKVAQRGLPAAKPGDAPGRVGAAANQGGAAMGRVGAAMGRVGAAGQIGQVQGFPAPTGPPSATIEGASTGRSAPLSPSAGGPSAQASGPPEMAIGLSPAFKFAGAYYFYANEKKVEATGIGNAWKLPVTDGPFLDSGVKLLWSFSGGVENDLKKVVNEKQCCLKLLVNGIKVSNPEVSFSAPGQLRTTTGLDTSPGGWPKSVTLEVTSGGKIYKSAQVALNAGPLISFFADYIFPTFKHARCQDCHAMGDAAAIVAQHKNAPYPIDLYDFMPVSLLQPDKTEGCAGCHGSDPSKGVESLEWKSPSALKGIDWRNKSAKQVCQTVLSKLPTGDQVHAHFNEDPRIEWALSSGWVPMGFDYLSTAPPGFTTFLKRIDKWIAAGLPCPP